MKYTYPYPHPAIACDCVVFGFDGRGLQILLIERGNEPCKGMWAFPGGFMQIDETAEACARRELREETSLDIRVLKQLGAFSGVHRDPRERVVSIAFYALVQPSAVVGGDDASDARWYPIDEVPQLAFDHDFILRKAMQQLRKDIYFEPIGFELLDREFTMPELQRLYEAILGVHFDRRNFEKKMLQSGIIESAEEEKEEEEDMDLLFKKMTETPAFARSYGTQQEMCSMDINSLFSPVSVSDEPVKRKPGRKGRKFSFNKDKYDEFKENNSFRFEF